MSWARLGFQKYEKNSFRENIRKNFLGRKHKNFLNIRARKVHFPKYKDFFLDWILFVYFFGFMLR